MEAHQGKDNDKAIFTLVMVFMLFCLFMTRKSSDMFMWDEAEYALTGYNIAHGLSYDNALRPPMLGVLSAPFIFISNPPFDHMLRLLMIFISWISLGSIMRMILKISDNTTALFSGLFLGFMPWFWSNSSHFLAEIPFILFSTIALLFYYRALYEDEKYFHGVWIFCGFAFLTRYTALLLGPIFIILFFLRTIQNREKALALVNKRVFWLSPLWLLMLLSPWLIHHQIVFGDFLLGFKIAKNQLPSYVPGISMPWYYYGKVFPTMVGIPIGILFTIGVFCSVYHKKNLGIYSLVIILFFLVWFSLFRYKEPRLISAYLPFIAIIAAMGYHYLTSKLAFLKTSMAKTAVIGILCFISYASIYEVALYNKTLGYPNLLEMAEVITENVPKEDLIMAANVPQIKWYTQRKAIGFPGDVAEFKIKIKEVNWVLIVNYEKGQPPYVIEKIVHFVQENPSRLPSMRTVVNKNGYFSLFVASSELSQILE